MDASPPAAAAAPVIEIAGLDKSFGKVKVLDALNWRVDSGRVVGLLGRNGAGKSTLIRCLLGLSPIDGGAVRVFGADAEQQAPAQLHRIGYVPQSFDLFPWMKVKQYLAFTRAFYANWQTSFVDELLERWEVATHKRIGELSQGQRQKLAIVRAIAPDPDLLVLDEPVASLDPQTRRLFLDELLRLTRRAGKTVVFSTHITSDLERADAAIALLKGGRIVLETDLAGLRARVRRVTLEGGAPPASLAAEGLLRYQLDQGRAQLIVDTLDDDAIAQLVAPFGGTHRVETMTLEDIFIEIG